MDRLGKIVRKARDDRGESLKALARGIGCSESFARHIESSRHVPISERLIEAVRQRYRLPRGPLGSAWKTRQRNGKAYYREYRRKQVA